MTDSLLWRIGSSESPSTDLYDNFRQPDALGAVEWVAGQPGQRWPMFHASEADPEGGYRLHPYTVVFELSEIAPAYRLRLHHLNIAPRLGHVEVRINDASGLAYLRPAPAPTSVIRLQAGLHTSLYAEGVTDVVIPGGLLRRGENRLTLVCHDGAPFTRFGSPDKIGRLDRMATGAGYLYRALEFHALPEAPASRLACLDFVPSVIYRRDEHGRLRERCQLHAELNGGFPGAEWRLEMRDGANCTTAVLALPAVSFGHIRQPFDLPEGEGPVACSITGDLGDAQRLDHAVTLARRRQWRVYTTPHLHTDIGYTHRQWEVAERLSFNLDRALDLLDETEAPAGERATFAYHLDSAFTLENFLATRGPERRAQLLRHLRAGRLGVPGNYVILLSQFAGLEDLVRNHVFADNFLRAAGLRAAFDAVVDVPSLTGSLPAVLAGCGVRYLVHASNQDRGPFRVNGRLHRQSPFYWQGHAGEEQILVWLSKMYCELRKVCGSPPDLSAAERGLGLWLDEFETPDYAPDAVLLYGQEADNTDLDAQPANFMHDWNQAYAYPELVPCDVREFFEAVEADFGPALTRVRGDGGAYWEDGAGSSLAATLEVRRGQAGLPAAERLAALAALHHPGQAFPLADFDEAWRQVLLYDEHTWGAFLSGSDPDALLQKDQWSVKAHMAASALQASERLLHSAATRHSLSWNASGREVVVYNPHSWTVSGPVTVEIGLDEVVVDAATGAPVPARRMRALNTQAWVELWIEALPGLSYRRHWLKVMPQSLHVTARTVPAIGAEPVVLENDHYRLVIDARRGCATSLFDKGLQRELAEDGPYGLGQFLYVRGGEGTTMVRNQADLPEPQLDVLDDFELETCVLDEDALGVRLSLTGLVPAGRLEVEWSLPAQARRVDVKFTYHKQSVVALEGVYVAFPFDLPGAAVHSDSQLGWVNWNIDTLPGACQAWLPLQTGVLASGDGAEVWLGSPDVPLFTVGDIVRGTWPVRLDVTGGRLFSYVLNNYWRVNYRGEQAGWFTFRYAISSARSIERDAAYQLGWQARQPLYAQRLSLQEFRTPQPPYDQPASGTLAQVGPEQVALTTLAAARHAPGYTLRLQEIAGANRTAEVGFPSRRIARAWETDLLEYNLHALDVEPDGTLRVPVPAWGLATVRVELEGDPA